MDTRFLSKEFLTQFIKQYQTFPCLWKIKSKEYLNKSLKDSAYEQLLQFCRNTYQEADIKFVKNKIQSLRNSFRKEMRKIHAIRRSGAETDDVYEPTLWYYKLLMFTKDQEIPDDSVENVEQGPEGESTRDVEKCSQIMKDISSEVDSPPEKSSNVMKTTTKKRRQNVKEKFLTTCINALNNDGEEDECAIVGKNVAAKLRKMEFHQQILAESLIQEVLMKGLFRELTRKTGIEESASTSTSYIATIPQDAECNESTSSAGTLNTCRSTYYEGAGKPFNNLD